jgi:ribonuclease E
MSNEHEAIFQAFISKCSDIYVVGGTFGSADVELSVQRDTNKLQVSIGGIDDPLALAVLDGLGIKLDAEEEAPQKQTRRRRKTKKEAEKLAEEDAEVEEEEEEKPAKRRRKRRTKAEIEAEKAAKEEDAEVEEEEEEQKVKPAKRRRTRAKAADEEKPKRRRRTRKPEPKPEPESEEEGEDDDEPEFEFTKAQEKAVMEAKDVDDVIEVVLNALPEDVDPESCTAAVTSVRDAGVAPALKGWSDKKLEAAVMEFFE